MTYFRAPSSTSTTSVQQKQNSIRPQVFAQRARSCTGRPRQGERANCDSEQFACTNDGEAPCLGGADCGDARGRTCVDGGNRRARPNGCAAASQRRLRRGGLRQRLCRTVRNSRRSDHLRDGPSEVDCSAKHDRPRGGCVGDQAIQAGAAHQDGTQNPPQLGDWHAPQAARPLRCHRKSPCSGWPATVALEASRNSGRPSSSRGATQG